MKKLAADAVALLAFAILASPADAQVRDHRSGAGSGSAPGGVSTANKPALAPGPGTGWPHSVLTGRRVACGYTPAPDEVVIGTDPQLRSGTCAALRAGFYPRAGNTALPNDSIRGVKVGPKVRVRVFRGPDFAGDWRLIPAGATSMAGGLAGSVSSMRVEPADRSVTCDDLRDGELALFENQNGLGDCVVLPATGAYYGAQNLGIENDSISSIYNMSAKTLFAAKHTDASANQGLSVGPYTKLRSIGDGRGGAMNDAISSIIVR